MIEREQTGEAQAKNIVQMRKAEQLGLIKAQMRSSRVALLQAVQEVS